jgi:hypothetical protein
MPPMPEIVVDCLIRPATSCFLEDESNNINHLVLISLRLARARAITRARKRHWAFVREASVMATPA